MKDCRNLEDYKKLLNDNGIEIDLEDYRGLTNKELSDLVDYFIRNKEGICKA